MTVCIGILCENRKKAVLVSDRMITSGLMVEFEHSSSKIDQISPCCAVMTSGNALLWSSISRRYLEIVNPLPKATKPKSIGDIASIIKKCFQTDRLDSINDAIFKRIGLDVEKLEQYAGAQGGLHPTVVGNLISAMDHYEYGLQMIVAGIDDKAMKSRNPAHIYMIVENGNMSCFDRMGYCVIGSGYPLANTTLMIEHTHAGLDLSDAVYYALLAKKTAEKAPGVGPETELVIISEEGTKKVEGSLLLTLYNQIKVQSLSSKTEREKIGVALQEAISDVPYVEV